MNLFDNFWDDWNKDHYKRHPKSKIGRNDPMFDKTLKGGMKLGI